MPSLRSFSIFQRFSLLIAIVVFGLIALSVASLTHQYSSLKNEQYLKTQNVVETAYSIIEHFYDLEQNNTLTQQQAQSQALNAIRALRYDKTNYFWINNYQPKMVMHPI
ncbi:MAG: cache domain-containing protein, partial [Pseudoalteromonas distincta]